MIQSQQQQIQALQTQQANKKKKPVQRSGPQQNRR
jgi:hypothetical protein